MGYRDMDDRFGHSDITFELWMSEGAIIQYDGLFDAVANVAWLSRIRAWDCTPFECDEMEWYYLVDDNFVDLYFKDEPILVATHSIEHWKPPAPIVMSLSTEIDRIADRLFLTAYEIWMVMEDEGLGPWAAGKWIEEWRQSSGRTD
jgi:hypothetical protein